jgi:acetoin utilization deacetylase AcuC-like enzyme
MPPVAKHPTSVLVVSRYLPEDIKIDKETKTPLLSDVDQRNDGLDVFNHPRYRRGLILKEMAKKHRLVQFMKPEKAAEDFSSYLIVQSKGLITFFETAWSVWDALGEEGQDPFTTLATTGIATSTGTATTRGGTQPLIPGVVPLPRDPFQRPSKNVMGQIGYYCTDTVTPVFAELKEELQWDVAVMQQAVDNIKQFPVVYALATHPGHHAAQDSFGGYCYLNHAAFAAKQLQIQYKLQKVAVLDVDYVG